MSMRRLVIRAGAALLLAGLAPAALAQDSPPAGATPPASCIRARDMATTEEFAAHQARLAAATTDEARKAEKNAFRDQMKARAAASQKTLCMGARDGGGPGPGPKGPGGGGGMGPGPGPGPKGPGAGGGSPPTPPPSE
jgi:hypothetical protein